MRPERKTVDYYKMELYINGEWVTVLDTKDRGAYKKLLDDLYWSPRIKHRGRKYRKHINRED